MSSSLFIVFYYRLIIYAINQSNSIIILEFKFIAKAMKKLIKTSGLIAIIAIACFSCGKESKTDTAKLSDTLQKAEDTVQVAAPSPEQLLEEKKQALLNSTNSKMNDVRNWLKQFDELRHNSITNNEDGTKNDQEIETINKVVYKNGITFEETLVYEGEGYVLFLPLLTAKEAKKLVDRLCRNMGGCLGPDEVDVKYKETKDGVMVEWGGGC
jgi:hypothetical protein